MLNNDDDDVDEYVMTELYMVSVIIQCKHDEKSFFQTFFCDAIMRKIRVKPSIAFKTLHNRRSNNLIHTNVMA